MYVCANGDQNLLIMTECPKTTIYCASINSASDEIFDTKNFTFEDCSTYYNDKQCSIHKSLCKIFQVFPIAHLHTQGR